METEENFTGAIQRCVGQVGGFRPPAAGSNRPPVPLDGHHARLDLHGRDLGHLITLTEESQPTQSPMTHQHCPLHDTRVGCMSCWLNASVLPLTMPSMKILFSRNALHMPPSFRRRHSTLRIRSAETVISWPLSRIFVGDGQ